MGTTQLPAATDASIPSVAVLPVDERRRRWFEMFLVLALSVGTSFLSSIYLLYIAPATPIAMNRLRALYGITHEVLGLLLLAYVLSRRNLSFRDLGLQWSRKDIVPGLAVTVLSFVVFMLAATLIRLLYYELFGFTLQWRSASRFFASPSIAAVPLVLLNPFFEELIVRAYLITEVQALTGSVSMAVVVSVVVQSSYHLYYGWFGAISLGFQFLVFSLYYVRTRRAIPIIVAHAAMDLYGILRLV